MSVFLSFLPTYIMIIAELVVIVFFVRTFYLMYKRQKETNRILSEIAEKLGVGKDESEENDS